jgi:hypothetical protein
MYRKYNTLKYMIKIIFCLDESSELSVHEQIKFVGLSWPIVIRLVYYYVAVNTLCD